jgi:hypothetical protein
MGTHDFDPVYKQPGGYAEPPEPKRGHGCFFWGCITVLILFLLLLIIIGVVTYLGYRAVTGAINEYTDTVPVKLPVVTRTDDEMKALHDKLKAFRVAMDSGKTSETLVLTADDINALIDEKEEFRGTAYVSIDGEKITGKISFPLSKTQLPLVSGRYLNGTATFRISIKDGTPILNADAIEVKGKPVPENAMQQLRDQNLMKDALNDPDARKFFKGVESLEVKDGKIIIKSHRRETEKSDADTAKDQDKPADQPKDKAQDGKTGDAKPPADTEKPAEKDKAGDTKPAEPPKPADAPKPDDTPKLAGVAFRLAA